MRNPSLSVIIPNYNGKHLLKRNLPSVLEALNNSGCNFEIIVVDDFSKDDSIDFIKRYYPSIILIECTVNGGFAKACNKGLDIAKHELILYLNSDIQLIPNYFDGLFAYFDKPDTFGVMSKIIGLEGETQDTARLYSRNGVKIKANTFFHVKKPGFWTPTAYLSGANALVNAKKMKEIGGFEIGGFDEIFSPFYYEDFELGLRAWRLGWKCYYHHNTYCIHDHSSTTKNYKTANWVKSIFFRNRLMMQAIHLDYPYLLLWYVQIIVFDFLFLWIVGKSHFYKGFFMFLRNRKSVANSRRIFKGLMDEKKVTFSFDDVKMKIEALLKGTEMVKGRKT
jgi:GT2 family glycosyltransferase